MKQIYTCSFCGDQRDFVKVHCCMSEDGFHSWVLFQEGTGEPVKLYWYCSKCRKIEAKK